MDLADVAPTAPILVPLSEAIVARQTVESHLTLCAPTDDVRKEIGPGRDPSRWSPFVAASTPSCEVVAVVAPRKLWGIVRLTGTISHSSDGSSAAIRAVRGPGGRSLTITHTIELVRAGAFRTMVRLCTSIRGRAAVRVSRSELREWHLVELEMLRNRIERNDAWREAERRADQNYARRRAPTVRARAFSTASAMEGDPNQ